jgi:hypothetical protein
MSNDDISLLNDLRAATSKYGTFSESSSSSGLSLENQLLLESNHDRSKKASTFSPTTLVVRNVGSTARDNFGK